MLPTKISELKDFFVNFDENEKIPGWVIEMLDILLEYEDQADTNTGPYREFEWNVVTADNPDLSWSFPLW